MAWRREFVQVGLGQLVGTFSGYVLQCYDPEVASKLILDQLNCQSTVFQFIDSPYYDRWCGDCYVIFLLRGVGSGQW